MIRYEYHKRGGDLTWSKWFKHMGDPFESMEDAKKHMKTLQENTKFIDKKTKLKHEFKIENAEE